MFDVDPATFFFTLFIVLSGGFIMGIMVEGRLTKNLLRKSCERLGYKYDQLEAMMKEVSEEK